MVEVHLINMTFTVQQEKEAYRNLSNEMQDFIMSNETTEIIDSAIKSVNLSEEIATQADSEILYSLIGLQSLDQALQNISSLSNTPLEKLSPLKNILNEKVFSKIKQLKMDSNSPIASSSSVPEIPPENLPAVEAGQIAHQTTPEEKKF